MEEDEEDVGPRQIFYEWDFKFVDRFHDIYEHVRKYMGNAAAAEPCMKFNGPIRDRFFHVLDNYDDESEADLQATADLETSRSE